MLGTTGSKDASSLLAEDGTIGGFYLTSSSRWNGVKGNIHQHIVYNKALTDDEVLAVASELVALHNDNV